VSWRLPPATGPNRRPRQLGRRIRERREERRRSAESRPSSVGHRTRTRARQAPANVRRRPSCSSKASLDAPQCPITVTRSTAIRTICTLRLKARRATCPQPPDQERTPCSAASVNSERIPGAVQRGGRSTARSYRAHSRWVLAGLVRGMRRFYAVDDGRIRRAAEFSCRPEGELVVGEILAITRSLWTSIAYGAPAERWAHLYGLSRRTTVTLVRSVRWRNLCRSCHRPDGLRNSRFSTLPDGLRGRASMKITALGTLNLARRSRQCSIRSSPVTPAAALAVTSGRRTT
jgi:hypothetical protein